MSTGLDTGQVLAAIVGIGMSMAFSMIFALDALTIAP